MVWLFIVSVVRLGGFFKTKLAELFFTGLSLTFLLDVSVWNIPAIFNSQCLNKHRKSKGNHNIYIPFED